MEYYTLNDGNRIPKTGVGAYLLAEGEECEKSIRQGLEYGYRLIDTANAYQNERSVAKAMRESGIPREDIFLTTKIWVQDYGEEQTMKAVDATLKRMQLDYIDLMLLHRPAGDNAGAYRGLEKAKEAGKVKSIGLCNHTASQLEALMKETNIVPALDQMECHPLQQQKALRPLLKQHQIILESWFPLGHGSKRINLNEDIAKIAEKHDRSIQQIILRWHIEEGFIVIPKSTNPAHIKDNLAIFDFALDEEDLRIIRALDQGRYMAGDPEDPQKNEEYLTVTFELD